MTTKQQKIQAARADLWYAIPSGVTTFSPCPCGRGGARGGRFCVSCAEEELAYFIGNDDACKYSALIKQLRQMEGKMLKL